MNRQQIIQELKEIEHSVERRGYRLFYPILKGQGKTIADFVRKNGIESTQMALPLLITNESMQKAFLAYYSQGGLIHAKWQYKKLYQGYKSLGGNINRWLKSWLHDMQMYVYTNLGTMITDINETTLDIIRKDLEEAMQKGYSSEKTARMIVEDTAGEYGKRRSLSIARTEGTRLASRGHRIASDAWARETGDEQFKDWIDMGDGRVRLDHAIAGEIKPIPADDKFTVGYSLMDAPGDPSAPAKETVNCRCRLIYLSSRMLDNR